MPNTARIEPKQIYLCMKGLKEISNIWPVAQLVHTVFETILGGSRPELEVKSVKRRRLQTIKTEKNDIAVDTSNQPSIKMEPTPELRPVPAERTPASEAVPSPGVRSSALPPHDSSATEIFQPNQPPRLQDTWDDPYNYPQHQPISSGPFDIYDPAAENWHINEEVFDAMWHDVPIAARDPE